MSEDGERIRALEIRADAHNEEIKRLIDLQTQMVRFVSAQEERNKHREHQDGDRHDDRWQVWFRSLFPAAVITAILNGVIYLYTTGTTP